MNHAILRDHQPDILFQGDTRKRQIWLLRGEIRWAIEQVQFVARTSYLTDLAGREAHLEWMKAMGQHIKVLRRRVAAIGKE